MFLTCTNMKICDCRGLFFLTPPTDIIEQSHIVLRKFPPIMSHYFWKNRDIKPSKIDNRF